MAINIDFIANKFLVEVDTIGNGNNVNITNLTSWTPPHYGIYSMVWDFGGLNGPIAAYHPVNVRAMTPGVYTITLTEWAWNKESYPWVLDEVSLVKQDYIRAVFDFNVVAYFSATPLKGTLPLTVDFTDESIGAIDTWLWDFGDGNTSTQQNPSHNYISSGSYTVSLTITASGTTDTLSKTNYITVEIGDFSATPRKGILSINSQFVISGIPNTINSVSWKRSKSNINDTKTEFSTLTNPTETFNIENP